MDSMQRILLTDILCRPLYFHALKCWSLVSFVHGLVVQAITDFTDERHAIEGDSVSLTCNNLSYAGIGVVWLYTPGEVYEGVQHIYTDGRMLSRWTSKCNVTTNAKASTLVLDSVHPDIAGYYECSEEHSGGFDVRFRVKLMVSGLEADGRTRIDIFDAFIISGTSVAAFLVVCTLLILLLSLKQRQKNSKGRPVPSKAMNGRIIQGSITHCEKMPSISKIQDVVIKSPLLLSESPKEHLQLTSDQMSFLKPDYYDLEVHPSEHDGA